MGLLLTGSALLWGPIQPDLAFARIPTDAIVTLRKIPRVPTPEDLMGARRPSTRGVASLQSCACPKWMVFTRRHQPQGLVVSNTL